MSKLSDAGSIRFQPSRARGVIEAPPSKSMAHRLLIAAGLADGVSVVRRVSLSDDIAATLDCLSALGVMTERCGDALRVTGTKALPAASLPCRESGSTLRFLLPLLTAHSGGELTGAPSLLARPMGVFEDLCRENEIRFERFQSGIRVGSGLTGGDYTLPGKVSSQFITGFLFALPGLPGGSTLTLTPPVVSRPYLDLTLHALERFGVTAEWRDELTLTIPGGQSFRPADVTVEGDWSNAAFFEAFNFIGGDVAVTGLDPSSRQGDRVFRTLAALLRRSHQPVELTDCPDLGPLLFVMAAFSGGGVFTGTARLRDKESDRVDAMTAELAKCGVRTTVTADSVTVWPPETLRAPRLALDSHGDHRIAMSLAVLLTVTGGVLHGAGAVKKSLPDFFDRLAALGVTMAAES